jgi:hypothetical protein
MSISITVDHDTFSYDSINGETGWFVTASNSPSFSAKIGKTVPYTMFASLFALANEAGYTSNDFAKITVPDLESRITLSPKPRAVSAHSDDTIKPVSRKSPLRQSIKLFF